MIKLLIGRSVECDICYDGVPQISSKHAEMTVGDDGRMIFTDYSTNGSYVNNQLVHHSSVMVAYGDIIMFPGNITLDWDIVSSKLYSAPQEVSPNASQVQQSTQPSYKSQDKLSFSQTMSDGFSSGFRNCLSLIGAMILYILTIWIPYINIGTTIALSTLPLLYARGESFNPLIIFESHYRREMGQYLLLMVFKNSAIMVSLIFMFFPSLVMTFSYLLSTFFLIEEGQDPISSMKLSNQATYGSKWTMFGVVLVFMLCCYAITGILFGLAALSVQAGAAVVAIIALLAFLASIVMVSIYIGLLGSMWNQLKNKTNY